MRSIIRFFLKKKIEYKIIKIFRSSNKTNLFYFGQLLNQHLLKKKSNII
jgi:hypothetical protein